MALTARVALKTPTSPFSDHPIVQPIQKHPLCHCGFTCWIKILPASTCHNLTAIAMVVHHFYNDGIHSRCHLKGTLFILPSLSKNILESSFSWLLHTHANQRLANDMHTILQQQMLFVIILLLPDLY